MKHYFLQTSKEVWLLLTDPEIATSQFAKDDTALFCVGNVCRKAIKRFGMSHTCNEFCIDAKLSKIDSKKFDDYDDTIYLPDGTSI